jgi:hypothetical protein
MELNKSKCVQLLSVLLFKHMHIHGIHLLNTNQCLTWRMHDVLRSSVNLLTVEMK